MADTRSAAPKVTYATLAAGQTPEFNKAYDEAVERVKGTLGKTHGLLIGGQETADLMNYYCDQLERHQGFEEPMDRLSDKEDNRDVLRPFGVWVIISPFNFPMALS